MKMNELEKNIKNTVEKKVYKVFPNSSMVYSDDTFYFKMHSKGELIIVNYKINSEFLFNRSGEDYADQVASYIVHEVCNMLLKKVQ